MRVGRSDADRAVRRAARLRDRLTDRFGAHWHIIHDKKTSPFGAAHAVAARGSARAERREALRRWRVISVAAQLTLAQSLGLATRAGGGEL